MNENHRQTVLELDVMIWYKTYFWYEMNMNMHDARADDVTTKQTRKKVR